MISTKSNDQNAYSVDVGSLAPTVIMGIVLA